MVVEGPAGIGKSPLLDAARARAAAAGMLALRAGASELESEYPFRVVRQLFEPALAVERRPLLWASPALGRRGLEPTTWRGLRRCAAPRREALPPR